MSKKIIEEKELFKIKILLEKASSTFDGLICIIDPYLLVEDEELINEIELYLINSMEKLKRLIECPAEANL